VSHIDELRQGCCPESKRILTGGMIRCSVCSKPQWGISVVDGIEADLSISAGDFWFQAGDSKPVVLELGEVLRFPNPTPGARDGGTITVTSVEPPDERFGDYVEL